MSEQPSNRSQRLRHRVIGAAVLAALAAIFLPAVLDFERTPEGKISGTNIPPRPLDLRVEEIPLTPPAVRPPAPAVPAASIAESDAARVIEDGDAGAGGSDSDSATLAPAAPTEPRAWVVRVGSFSSNDNALALRNRLRKAGFDAFVDQVKIEDATMSRVHVGPEIERARGDALRDRLEREMGLKGLVVGYE
jgi:DedD protein